MAVLTTAPTPLDPIHVAVGLDIVWPLMVVLVKVYEFDFTIVICNCKKFDLCWLYQLHDSVLATRNFCYLLHISNGHICMPIHSFHTLPNDLQQFRTQVR